MRRCCRVHRRQREHIIRSSSRALQVFPFAMADGDHYDHLFKVIIIRPVFSLTLALALRFLA
jgi:hypothetical protein